MGRACSFILYLQKLLWSYASVCASPTISGIVIRENSVDKDTMFTDKAVSRSNFAANMVVAAATGAEAAITQTTRITPRICRRYISTSVHNGITTRRRKIARYCRLSSSACFKFVRER